MRKQKEEHKRKRVGRAGLSKAMVLEIRARREAGGVYRDIASAMGISVKTAHRYGQSVGLNVRVLEEHAHQLRAEGDRCERLKDDLKHLNADVSPVLKQINDALVLYDSELKNRSQNMLDAVMKELKDERARLDSLKLTIGDELTLRARGERFAKMLDAKARKLTDAALQGVSKSLDSRIKTLDEIERRVGLKVQEVAGVRQLVKDLDVRREEFENRVSDVSAGLVSLSPYLVDSARDAIVRITEAWTRRALKKPTGTIAIGGSGKVVDLKNLPPSTPEKKKDPPTG